MSSVFAIRDHRTDAASLTKAEGPRTFVSASPTPMPTAEARKKRHILDVLKSKERLEKAQAQSPEPVITSPLPPLTPKAAKMLGVLPSGRVDRTDEYKMTVNTEGENTGKPQAGADGSRDTESRPTLRRKSSLSWLDSTISATRKERESKFKEEDMRETDQSGPSSTPGRLTFNWRSHNKKAMRMLDLNWPRSKNSQRSTDLYTESISSQEDLGSENGYNSDSNLTVTRRLASKSIASKPIPARKSRSRSRKKAPKSLERMSPITEASLSEDGFIILGDGDNIGLAAISEDEQPWNALEEDVFQFDNDGPDGEEAFEDGISRAALLRRESTKLQRIEHPEMIQVKSPLQKIESVFLTNQEKRMTMDLNNHKLEMEHIKMKRALRDLKERNIVQDDLKYYFLPGCAVEGKVYDGATDNESYYDISSYMDLEEEPITDIHQLMTLTPIAPGMVKMVEIPLRGPEGSLSEAKKDSWEVKAMNTHKREGFVMIGHGDVCIRNSVEQVY